MRPLMKTPMTLFMKPLLNKSTLQLFSRWTNRTIQTAQVQKLKLSYSEKDLFSHIFKSKVGGGTATAHSPRAAARCVSRGRREVDDRHVWRQVLH